MKKSAKNKQVLVVCHDAGGAEIVSSFVCHNLGKYKFSCLVKGPAEKIFKRKRLANYLIGLSEADRLIKNKKANWVLTGTSGAAVLELKTIILAKKYDLKVVAFLDHWANYRERFGYPEKKWKDNLPDKIWVGDKPAYRLAKKLFGSKLVEFKKNYYYEDLVSEYKKQKITIGENFLPSLLFISEPLNAENIVWGDDVVPQTRLTESEILKKILDSIIQQKKYKSIIIRLHPAEASDKYDELLKDYLNTIKIIKSKDTLVQDLKNSSIVGGMESTALVIAYLNEKKVFSVLSGRSNDFTLPFPIKKLKKIEDL